MAKNHRDPEISSQWQIVTLPMMTKLSFILLKDKDFSEKNLIKGRYKGIKIWFKIFAIFSLVKTPCISYAYIGWFDFLRKHVQIKLVNIILILRNWTFSSLYFW